MVVDDEALRDHILSGHLPGAAIDVFPAEPKAQGDPFDSPLRGLDNVLLTPHVGGSTQEAQEEIGSFVATKLHQFVAAGATALSVNLPEVLPARPAGAFRTAYLHTNVPGVLASTNRVLADAGANVLGQSLYTGRARLRRDRHRRGPPPRPLSGRCASLRRRSGCAPGSAEPCPLSHSAGRAPHGTAWTRSDRAGGRGGLLR